MKRKAQLEERIKEKGKRNRYNKAKKTGKKKRDQGKGEEMGQRQGKKRGFEKNSVVREHDKSGEDEKHILQMRRLAKKRIQVKEKKKKQGQ